MRFEPDLERVVLWRDIMDKNAVHDEKRNKVGKSEIVADFAAEAKLNKKEAAELMVLIDVVYCKFYA